MPTAQRSLSIISSMHRPLRKTNGTPRAVGSRIQSRYPWRSVLTCNIKFSDPLSLIKNGSLPKWDVASLFSLNSESELECGETPSEIKV